MACLSFLTLSDFMCGYMTDCISGEMSTFHQMKRGRPSNLWISWHFFYRGHARRIRHLSDLMVRQIISLFGQNMGYDTGNIHLRYVPLSTSEYATHTLKKENKKSRKIWSSKKKFTAVSENAIAPQCLQNCLPVACWLLHFISPIKCYLWTQLLAWLKTALANWSEEKRLQIYHTDWWH